jgi:stalled ribosome alternative rescue factor ArfA
MASKSGRGKPIKRRPPRRNPVARTLRDPAFRARREANRRRYARKPKHKQGLDPEQAE